MAECRLLIQNHIIELKESAKSRSANSASVIYLYSLYIHASTHHILAIIIVFWIGLEIII
jgi:hypothetical protein